MNYNYILLAIKETKIVKDKNCKRDSMLAK